MALRRIVISLLLLALFSFQLLSAQSEYLELNYGINGVATIPFDGYAYTSQELAFDKSGRGYIGLTTLSIDSSNAESSTKYLFTRLSERGFQEDWGIEIDYDSLVVLVSSELDSTHRYILVNEKIISDQTTIANDDTTRTLVRYDLDFNTEAVYNQVPESTYPFYFWLYDYYSPPILLDDQNRLTLADEGKIYKFKADGKLDTSFGQEGVANVYEPNSVNNLIFFNWYSDLIQLEDNSLIYSSIEYYFTDPDSIYAHRGNLAKVTADGVLDNSFAENGYFFGSSFSYFSELSTGSDNNFYTLGHGMNQNCDTSTYLLKSLNENGQANIGFGDDGNFQSDCGYLYSSDMIVGQKDEILLLEYEIIYQPDSVSISHLEYFLKKVDKQGAIDPTFGNEGQLKLDFIGGDQIINMTVDDNANVYFLCQKYLPDFYSTDNNLYITKLRAEKIWSNLPSSFSQPLELSLTPNPSLGTPAIQNDGRTLTDVEITLFDFSGRLISVKDISVLGRNEASTVSDQDLSAGAYIVKVTSGRSVFEEKVIVIE